jgi:hypothetical protein
MIDRDTDPSALPGRAWNADWVDRKAAQKARKCRLKDHYDRLIVSGAAIASHGWGTSDVPLMLSAEPFLTPSRHFGFGLPLSPGSRRERENFFEHFAGTDRIKRAQP